MQPQTTQKDSKFLNQFKFEMVEKFWAKSIFETHAGPCTGEMVAMHSRSTNLDVAIAFTVLLPAPRMNGL